MTAADVEALALALSKARDKAVNVHDLLQDIAEAEGVPEELRTEAERLRWYTISLSNKLEAERKRVREQGATCQDGAAFGPTRPPPPPPGAVACAFPGSCSCSSCSGVRS